MAPCQTEFSEACLESSGVHAVACPESAFSVLISIGPGSGCSTELRTLSVHTGVALIHNSRADRKSTRLNSSHVAISYAVFCLKKKNMRRHTEPCHLHPSAEG